MSVSVLLVSHGRLSQILLETVEDVLGELTLPTEVLEVRRVNDTDPLVRMGERVIEKLDQGDGVLVLTDAFGSTPSNIANRIARSVQAELVADPQLTFQARFLRAVRFHSGAGSQIETPRRPPSTVASASAGRARPG